MLARSRMVLLCALLSACGKDAVTAPKLVITTTSLAAGTVGTAYSQTLNATGGTGNYTWTVVSGSLPAGLTLSTAGVLSGPPTIGATSTFTVQATSGSATATQALSVTVSYPPVSITTTSLASSIVGIPYTQTLQATGGMGTYTWSVLSGSLPAGFGLSTAGVLSGTPSSAATSTFTVQATSGSATATQALSVAVSYPVLAITAIVPQAGIVGATYTLTLQATGGTGTNTWSVVSGSLPTGLTLSTAGVLSGTPTGAATSTFTVQVTSGSATATAPLSVNVYPLLVFPSAQFHDGTVNVPYTSTINNVVTGGTGTNTWSVVSGSLPTGLTLSTAGVLSGTPTVLATSVFSLQVTSGTQTATQAFTFYMNGPPLVVTTASLPGGAVGTAYSDTLQATGGYGSGSYTWSVVAASGSLPTGMTLSASGVLNGTPTTIGTSNFEVMATSGPQGGPQTNISGAVQLSVTISPGALVITTTTVPNVVLGVAYSTNLQVTGGNGGTSTYTWSLLSGSLPGLSLFGGGANGGGVVSGTAIAVGSYGITVQVANGTQTATQALTVTIAAPNTPVQITSTSWPAQQVGAFTQQMLRASGGFGTYVWSIASGSLPAGMALSSDGIIGGTPTTAGTSSVTVQVTSGSSTTTQVLSIVVNP